MVDTLVIVFWWMDTWQFPSFLKHFTTWRDRTSHKTRLLEAPYFAKTSTWNSQATSLAKLEKLVAWAHAQFPARWRLARLARKGFGADGLRKCSKWFASRGIHSHAFTHICAYILQLHTLYIYIMYNISEYIYCNRRHTDTPAHISFQRTKCMVFETMMPQRLVQKRHVWSGF